MEELEEKTIKKLEDGWEGHKKADPPLNFESDAECDYCDAKFPITLEKNVKKEEVLIYLNFAWKQKFAYLGGTNRQKVYEQATKYETVCPRCGYKKELFCVESDPRKVVNI